MRKAPRLLGAFLAPVLLAAVGASIEAPPAGEEISSPSRAAGWGITLKKAVRLADELGQYPVRQEAFRRSSRALAAAQETMREAEQVRGDAKERPSLPAELASRMKGGAGELAECRDRVREVAHEFGKGLEISYEGAFADFSARAEDLAGLLNRLALALENASR